ncbi:tyrosine-protein phosphatase [Pseudomonas sp. LRF_L74]|uniref:tyrosine-protein phosphatase n=1 Tax=Pseudomonas sp. LRF_L74 TaxID=3369422 RepID=UPI003F5DB68F
MFRLIMLLSSLYLLLLQAASATEPLNAGEWAQPVDKSFNLYRMTPLLYRSALPGSDNLDLLNHLQVRTVVSLIKDDDSQWAGSTLMRLVSYPVHADRVDDADVIHVLGQIQEAQRLGPVLLHCKHGRDRTGLFAAMYRTAIEGWDKEAALDEMRNNGFGDDASMADAIDYVTHADVPAIRKALAEGDCGPGCQWRERVIAQLSVQR